MTAHLRTFRLQFLESPGERVPTVLDERDLYCADVDAAIREAATVPWPSRARACRVAGSAGSEVAYRLVGSLEGLGTVILKIA